MLTRRATGLGRARSLGRVRGRPGPPEAALRSAPSPLATGATAAVGGSGSRPIATAALSTAVHRANGSLHSLWDAHHASPMCDPTRSLWRQPQVRWKRRDGHKASLQRELGRPPTQKQRKKHNRKLQQLQVAQEARGAPGSKAGPRREYYETLRQDLLQSESALATADQLDPSSYGLEDALLDDLMGNTRDLSSQPTPHPKYRGHQLERYRDHVLRQMERYQRKRQGLLDQQAPNRSADGQGQSTMPAQQLSTEQQSHLQQFLPTDVSVSLALAAFRDKHGTRRSRPVGLAGALGFLLQDLGVPLGAVLSGEHAVTTLLTCCRSPAEGRKVLQLLREQEAIYMQGANHGDRSSSPPTPFTEILRSAYIWSILADLYAKAGDYKGCAGILEEMLQQNVPPVLATYTSFLAACYSVCRDGRVPHAVRSEAYKASWDKWMEMRIVGIDPDVMAYGAMIRLCASVGQAERALSLLDEMEQMQVKPTTLCFSSALRAVAKSQAIAIRFEQGASPRNRRREFLASHHGKMALQIVRMAENAQVEQDDGFVSALVLCAANAGDLATAKAIYVASEIRKLDQFRTVGPDSHLAILRGEPETEIQKPETEIQKDRRLMQNSSHNAPLAVADFRGASDIVPASSGKRAFEEREYGKDSRVLSALLFACANAVDQNGIGTIWQGRENRGYLCENSLRLITAPKIPHYVDKSIPFQSVSDDLTWEGEDRDEGYRDQKRSKRAFRGVEELEGGTIDDLDETFAKIYLDEDGELKPEFRKTTPTDIWRQKYADQESLELLDAVEGRTSTASQLSQSDSVLSSPQAKVDMYFDYDTMRWVSQDSKDAGKPFGVTHSFPAASANPSQDESKRSIEDEHKDMAEDELYFDYDTMRWQTRKIETSAISASTIIQTQEPGAGNIHVTDTSENNKDVSDNVEEEMYFDLDKMRWKTRPKQTVQSTRTAFETKILHSSGGEMATQDEEAEFDKFYQDLRSEIRESGEDVGQVDEEEARELFALMKDEYQEVMEMDIEELIEKGLVDRSELPHSDISTDPVMSNDDSDGFEAFLEDVKDGFNALGRDGNDHTPVSPMNDETLVYDSSNLASSINSNVESTSAGTITLAATEGMGQSMETATSNKINALDRVVHDAIHMEPSIQEVDAMGEIDELRTMLPTYSDARLRSILRVFKENLDDPPLLDLVPLVRETMPDYVTATWLKQMSRLTARYVVQKAALTGAVDLHMLNGVLELETRSGSLDRAVEFYETEFGRHGLAPNEYSHRLLLQMFVTNNRFPRALAFKQKLKEAGTDVDILSFGSLIDYCGRHGQVGSGLLLLKECLAIHGAAPGEASLARLRALCRRDGLQHELEAMAGPDPVEWLRHGEAKLKREYSKKGRRDVQFPRNRLVQL